MSLSTIEIICAPYEIWLAPVATAFPDIDAAPAGPWAKLGTSGDKSYEEKGVTVTFNETLNTFTSAASTAPRKVWRTAEQVGVAADLADMSVATLAKLLNDADITTVAHAVGTAGSESIKLLKGSDVAIFAALVRGVSPEGPAFAAQYQLPIVYQSGNLAPVYSKSGAAMLAANLMTLEDDADGFGEYIAQTAAPGA